MDPVIRSHIAMRLRYIEEVACGSQVSLTGAPGKEEATKGILRSLGGDWKADAEAIVECHRAEVMEWWQDFPERQLLIDLYRRASRWRAGCGSRDSRRRPSHEEGLPSCQGTAGRHRGCGPAGLRVGVCSRFEDDGSPLVAPPRRMLPQWVATVHQALPVQPGPLRRSRAHLGGSWTAGAMTSRRPLLRWRQEVVSGCRRRPPKKAVARPIGPSIRPRSCVTSRFSSPSRSCAGLEYRRGVASPAVLSRQRRWGVEEPFRGNCETHLEGVQRVFRARDAEILEGHRQTRRAIPIPD